MSFTCDECRQKQGLEHGLGYPFMGISRGPCEDCGRVADCEDLHGNSRFPVADKIEHDYLSTACFHGQHDRCRRQCKFCDAACNCECHKAELSAAGTGERGKQA
jgi:hypothetical protein